MQHNSGPLAMPLVEQNSVFTIYNMGLGDQSLRTRKYNLYYDEIWGRVLQSSHSP